MISKEGFSVTSVGSVFSHEPMIVTRQTTHSIYVMYLTDDKSTQSDMMLQKIARNKKACKKTHRLKINEVAVGGGVEPPKGS